MQTPNPIVLSRREQYRVGCGAGALCLFFLGLALVLGNYYGASPEELLLPAAALGSMGLAVTVFLLGGTALSVVGESRAIRKLLAGERWAEWQYSPEEWKRIADENYQLERGAFKPGYNLIVGPLMGAFIAGAALFVIRQPEFTPVLLMIAAGVTLLYIVTGLGLPLLFRRNARLRYEKRLRVAAPRLYMNEKGVYHEVDGYTSLDSLTKVQCIGSDPVILTFQTRNPFRPGMSIPQSHPFPVPAGREAEAQQLVGRYRQTL
jgi:hypothetical protein